MKKTKLIIASLLLSPVLSFAQQAQQNANEGYDQHEAFAPGFHTTRGNEFRSASGAPGPKYWQNRANYKINVRLDTVQQTLSGSVTITYKNNSPDKLDYIWLQLDQNIYRKDSRSEYTTHTVPGKRWASLDNFYGGYDIKAVRVDQKGKAITPEIFISDTRLRVNLPTALKPGSDSVRLTLNYSFPIPEYGTDRMGRKLTPNGWIYQIAQWFPRLAVYDDVTGWDTLPYLGAGEFYLEYGDIDYTVTAPSNIVIIGSGALLNQKEVLAKPLIDRLAKAAQSTETVNIRSEADFNNPASRLAQKELTWHFKINNSRDAAWAASKAFLWDAARIDLPSGRKALAQAVYPAEAKGPENWGGAAGSVKQVIEYYSKTWFEYPWPVATAVGGSIGGMEYPGVIFCGARPGGTGRAWGIANHEFGHNWFPMVVGSNERRYTFMDEGFDTFINGLNAKQYTPPGPPAANRRPQQDIYTTAKTMFGPDEEPSYIYEDVLQFQRIGTDAYRKPALALSLLRSEVVGEKLFDIAFKNYIHQWAFKHPTPEDFFRSIENGTGEDLGWFWRGWFYNTWKLDQAVTNVTYIEDDPTKGSTITIKNVGKLVMPVTIEVKEQDGKTSRIKLPAEVWQRGPVWSFKYKSSARIDSVTIDPDHIYPDINPENNVLKPTK